jgi:hypothetical protein
LGFCDCRRSSFHIVKKVLVEIIRIVVVEVEMLRGIALEFLGLVCLRTGLKECSVGKADTLAVREKHWDLVPT